MPRGRPRKKQEEAQPQQPIMTKNQTRSLARACLAMERICEAYSSLTHPNVRHVVELDDARLMLHQQFEKEINKEIEND